MYFFADTAEVNEIVELGELGLLDGVTTNPTLIMKSGRPVFEVLQEICSLTDGPVSAEVVALDAMTMVEEGKKLAEIAPNIVVKVPLTHDGLKACRLLTSQNYDVNVTLCFSANQALLAAKAGATFISPFLGRLDDAGLDGIDLIEDIRLIYDNYGFETQILAASVRTPLHIKHVAMAGSDAATAHPSVFKQLASHPMTDQGIEKFLKDWNSTGMKIV